MSGYGGLGYTIANSYGVWLHKHNMMHTEYYSTEEFALVAAVSLKKVYGSAEVVHGYKIVDQTIHKQQLRDTQVFYQEHEAAMDDLRDYVEGKRRTPVLRPEVVALLREQFPIGTRVECIEVTDLITPIPKGTQGNVTSVDDIGTIHVNWDTGPQLGLVFGEDKYKVVK